MDRLRTIVPNGNRLAPVLSQEQETAHDASCRWFLRRFLLQGLPRGFMRIGHYGFLRRVHSDVDLSTLRRSDECDRTTHRRSDYTPFPTAGEYWMMI